MSNKGSVSCAFDVYGGKIAVLMCPGATMRNLLDLNCKSTERMVAQGSASNYEFYARKQRELLGMVEYNTKQIMSAR